MPADILALPGVEIAIVLLLVGIVFFGFVREVLPADVVALLAMGPQAVTRAIKLLEGERHCSAAPANALVECAGFRFRFCTQITS